jgi:hypothetical protein
VIKPPSLVHEYDLIYSGDPALALPEDLEARKRAFDTAVETGDWRPLLGGTSEPTVFTLRPLTGSQYDWWYGETQRRQLSNPESAALILRLALRGVKNFGAFKVEPVNVDGQQLAKTDIVDAIYSVPDGRLIVMELAGIVIERATTAPRPKS